MIQITDDKKRCIIYLLHQGLTFREVAFICSVSVGTVHNVREMNSAEFEEFPLNKPGSKYKLSEAEKRFCGRLFSSGRAETATSAAKITQEDLGISVSRQTVSRGLKQSGFNSYEKIEKPQLSGGNIRARLTFAKKY